MEFYVDGGCRGNGHPGAIGAAAAVRRFRNGAEHVRTRQLETYCYNATNQRAEILAIILALEWQWKFTRAWTIHHAYTSLFIPTRDMPLIA